MSENLSEKFKFLSFILILLVLYIHSGFHENEIKGLFLNSIVQELISGKIGRVAVPLFFMISGYLFFLNTESGITSLVKKIRTRFKSILIPYVIGCLFFYFFLLVIQTFPSSAGYMNSSRYTLEGKSTLALLKEILWMQEGSNSPLAFHLWFLRDLFIVVLASPILFYLFKFTNWYGLIFLIILSSFTILYSSSLTTSLLWFSIGGLFSFTKTTIEFKKTRWFILLLAFYILISLLEYFIGLELTLISGNLLILIGIAAIWTSFDHIINMKIFQKIKNHFLFYSSFTFFIYLFHEPTLNIIRKLMVAGLGKNSMGYLAAYLCSPLIFIFLFVLLGAFIRTKTPKVYSFLVGGRL